MPRPKKIRRVEKLPQFRNFKPTGVKMNNLEEIELKIEELEAIRLKDLEGLHQVDCAKKMNISRQTFQLIIDAARLKVATALIEGKSIHINGGDYVTNTCQYICKECKSRLDLVFELDKLECPICGNTNLKCIASDDVCRGKCNKLLESD